MPYSPNAFGGRIMVRTEGPPSELAKTIRTAVQTTNAQTPVEELQTLDELRNGRLAVPGLTAALLSIFAAIALVMTLAGLAGLIGTSVSQRTREFGLRMALGASRGSVLKLVLSQGVVLVVIGLALGIVGAYAFSQLITGFLFETTATNRHGVRRHCGAVHQSPPSSPHSARRVGRRRSIRLTALRAE